MNEEFGTQWVLIGTGSPSLESRDEDLDAVADILMSDGKCIFQLNLIRGKTADDITLALAKAKAMGHLDGDLTVRMSERGEFLKDILDI